jgi:cell division protein FtsN
MDTQIVNTIKELIVEYNYVSVPQLGGFVSNYQAAQIVPEKGIILPPSRKLSFNANLNEDDGLLVKTIASSLNKTVSEAQKMLLAFVQDVFKKLESGKTVEFSKIGKLKFNNELNIEFEAENSENLNPYSYGMVKANCQVLEAATVIKEKQKLWINRKTLMRAAVIVPFLVMGTLLSVHLNQIGFFQSSYQQMASIIDWSTNTEAQVISEKEVPVIEKEATTSNPVAQAIEEKTNKVNALDYTEPQAEVKVNKIEVTPVLEEKEAPVVIEEKVKPVVEAKPIKEELVKSKLELQKYQLVAGSFKSEDNANRLAEKIKKQQLESVVIKLGNRYRVIAASYSNKSQAQKTKKELKAKSISTWINTAK